MKKILRSAKSAPSVDLRHASVRDEIVRVYEEENNGLKCPWSAKHAKFLQRILLTASWPPERWHSCILNRFASEGANPAEDPIVWIPKLINYARGPLNRFNKADRVPEECRENLVRLCDRYAEVHGR